MVPAVALVEMRRFRKAQRGAFENIHALANELPLLRRILLQNNSGEAVGPRPMIPKHVHEILATVVVMKERWVEAAAVEINGIRPVAIDARAGDQVVVEVAHGGTGRPGDTRAAKALHVRVDKPEQAIRVAQARRPHATRIRIAQHVELAGAVEWARQQPPIDQVARVMNLHAREPLEGRRGDVVIVADADDGWVGIEPWENRIANGHAGLTSGVATARRSAS